MKSFVFKKIDAFATGTSSGNPAGVIYLEPAQNISAEEMQRIAIELKGFVNEVGYVRHAGADSFDLKYYSSEREVDFCGHATIAIMYDIIKADPLLMKSRSVTIITKNASLLVENRISTEDAVFISAPSPRFFRRELSRSLLSDALRIREQEIGDSAPVAIVNAGLETLLVPVKGLDSILSMMPVQEELKLYCERNSIDIVLVYTDEVADVANTYRTRVFAPTFGYLEDPATGSGTAALGHYLLENKRWDGRPMSIEQSGNRLHPNIVKLSAGFDDSNGACVMFGGGAITRISGHYFLT